MKQIINPKTGYIDYSTIIEKDVDVYMILGQRADGKTYGILENSISEFFKSGTPSAYIRRFDESLRKNMIADLLKPQIKNITKMSKNTYTNSVYKSKRFYPAFENNDKLVPGAAPFLYAYSLNTWENAKGADSGEFYNVIFDEFVSTSKYLSNEYVIFENVLSSILRNRGKSRIFMLGNPVNQICPYFDEFNIDVHKLQPGDIVYRLSAGGYKMKFVYCPPIPVKNRASIFDFRRKKSSITTGYWEFGDFPHLPGGMVKDSEKLCEFAVIFRNQFAVCEFYMYKDVLYCFWRPGNEDKILDDREHVIFSDAHIFQDNILMAWDFKNEMCRLYDDCVKSNRQYFADNKTGNLAKMWYHEFLMKAGRFA